MRSEKPICALPGFPNVVFETVPMFVWLTMALSRPFKQRSSSASSFNASLLQAIDSVMSLALCPKIVSQASQHFSSSEKQATREGCFARQSICSVVSLHSGMSRAVHPQEFSKVDVDHRHNTAPHHILLYGQLSSASFRNEPWAIHTALFSASEQCHCALVVRDSEWV